LTHAVRFMNQTSRCIAAIVVHVDAIPDQLTLIQLM
jgi:hypothetical protein